MFKIIGADTREYGPVTKEQLLTWIAQGRANGTTPVQAEGSADWKPLASYPEFQEALNAKTPPVVDAPVTGFYPEQVLERDYRLDIGGLINSGIELLKRDFSIIFPVTAVFLAIQLGIGVFSSIPIVGALVSLASVVVQGPLLAGVYIVLLRRIRHEPADVGMVFSGFGNRTGQYILASLIPGLLSLVASLPGIVMLILGIVFTSNRTPIVGVPLIVFGAIVILFIALYFGISWAFTLPLVVDKKIDFWSAMQLSRAMVMKHFWAVTGLALMVGIINIVGLAFCFVGLFLTVPVTMAALLYAFETIFGSQPAPLMPAPQRPV